MSWVLVKNYNNNLAFEVSGADEKALSSVFIHVYATKAEAQAHPQHVDDVAQQAVVNSVLSLEGTPGPGGTRKPAGAGVPASNALNDASQLFGDVTGLAAIGRALEAFLRNDH